MLSMWERKRTHKVKQGEGGGSGINPPKGGKSTGHPREDNNTIPDGRKSGVKMEQRWGNRKKDGNVVREDPVWGICRSLVVCQTLGGIVNGGQSYTDVVIKQKEQRCEIRREKKKKGPAREK